MTARAIGIDVGGSMIKAALVDRHGNLDRPLQVPTPSSPAEIGDSCGSLAAQLAPQGAVAVGVGSAGLVDREAGVHVWGPHVAGPAPIVESVQAMTGLPAVLDTDTNAAAYAELRLGAARDTLDSLLVVLGTGIGGGIVVDGEIYRGRGFAGEIGHLVVEPAGPPCACGRSGCWETFVSGTVFDAEAAEHVAQNPRGPVAEAAGALRPTGVHLMRAAEAGDPEAIDRWNRVGEWLGKGIAQLAAILDPELVVVGGAPSAAGDLLLDPARDALSRFRHGPHIGRPLPIVKARFVRDSAVIGAGLQALEKIDE